MKACMLAVWITISALSLPAQSVKGLYQGVWTSPSGFEFGFLLELTEQDGVISGSFVWRVLKYPPDNWYYSTRPADAWARETVSGKVKAGTEIELRGISKEDPFSIIAPDVYILVFSEDFLEFAGKSGNHGTWDARISGRRVDLS